MLISVSLSGFKSLPVESATQVRPTRQRVTGGGDRLGLIVLDPENFRFLTTNPMVEGIYAHPDGSHWQCMRVRQRQGQGPDGGVIRGNPIQFSIPVNGENVLLVSGRMHNGRAFLAGSPSLAALNLNPPQQQQVQCNVTYRNTGD